ncbi:glycosyltransferase [Rubrivivax gelatinosus]|uniref:glycosyltransferase n=1 Tax=Rubrivivax gelatinosus TaxID=28068 RepID=UPI00030CE6AA|nr:glycosyltransferase [Rubrivivax gelatinosus]MBG6079399.1 glycosyltransferase involved in cell wall biosynthesis [Rubrivivax gelatinosus]
MATYNGERYLPEQVATILAQLGPTDELVVVDDASSDGTVAYLEGLGDPRIRVHRNIANLGHVQSFAKVIGLARGSYILMADQDDLWIEGRLAAMRDALARGTALVSTNSEFMDGEGHPIPALHADLDDADSGRHAANIARIFTGRAFYDGCAMGLRAELRSLILPIPSYVESHDLWIAMAANAAGSNMHLARRTLRRRVHGKNASVVSRPLGQKLWSRAIFLLSLLHIGQRLLTRRPHLGR